MISSDSWDKSDQATICSVSEEEPLVRSYRLHLLYTREKIKLLLIFADPELSGKSKELCWSSWVDGTPKSGPQKPVMPVDFAQTDHKLGVTGDFHGEMGVVSGDWWSLILDFFLCCCIVRFTCCVNWSAR